MSREDIDPKAFPEVVERVLSTYPFVTGARVELEPHTGVVRARICIDRRAAISVDAMLRHAASQVPPDWVPTAVSLVSSVDSPAPGLVGEQCGSVRTERGCDTKEA